MKWYVFAGALFLVALNACLLTAAADPYRTPLAGAAVGVALLVLILAALTRSPKAPKPEPVVAVPPPAPAAPQVPKNQAEAEVVALLGLLQEKGRLIDFLMDDITPYEDAQVGAAARVVHQGCRDVLKEHLKIVPIADAAEGARITVPAEHASDEYRLIGRVAGEPPFSGTLVHKGWKAEWVKLPRVLAASDGRLPSITPAEVELK